MKIDINRKGIKIDSLNLNNAIYSKHLMGEHSLVFSIISPKIFEVRIGDYVNYKGEYMKINTQPKYTQISVNDFRYEITFQGSRHNLETIKLKNNGSMVFDYSGDLEDFMYMFLVCINDVDPGWSLGDIEPIEPFSLRFDKVDCLSALSMISEAAASEWEISGKVISIKKHIAQPTTLKLSYGMGNGLYSLTRQALEDKGVITRAYAIGGVQNLPKAYEKDNLTLDGYIEDTEAIELYGIREGIFEDTEIFPKRTGTVEEVEEISEKFFTIKDSELNFDLNDHLIEGTEPKIVFKSGALNGQEFPIVSFNNNSKIIRYKAKEVKNGTFVPFGSMVAEIGDKYTLVGIRMPDQYVTDALQILSTKRLEFLNSNKSPKVIYELDADVLWMKKNNIELKVGDIIQVIDEKIGLNEKIRVNSVSYPAIFPELVQGMKFIAQIGNEVTYTYAQKLENDIKQNQEVITQVGNTAIENDRRNVKALNEFKELVIDPDNNLQEALVQGLVAFFGTASQLFDLDPIPSFHMGPDTFGITSTNLIHKIYEIEGLGHSWELPAFEKTGLDPKKPYYLSAKCSKTTLSGHWEINEGPVKTDDVFGYWHFNLGILSSVIDGERSFRATRGSTLISGGQIETDMITSYLINVQRLFAQEITATNLFVTGNSKIGPFSLDNDGLFYKSAPSNGVWFRINRNGLQWDNLIGGIGSPTFRSYHFSMGQNANNMMELSNTGETNSQNGLFIDVSPRTRYALKIANGEFIYEGDSFRINNGDIFINGKMGLTGRFEYDRGNGVYEMEFEKGILVGQKLISGG